MKEPYKITIEQYNMEYSIKADSSDITFTEYVDMLERITLAAGWSQEHVNELFGE